MTEAIESNGSTQTGARGRRQVLVGKVISDKMDKTIIVAVERVVIHPLYRRRMKRTSKYHVHDGSNECREGDRVQIVASRPLSKLKRWRVREVLERAGS